MSINRQGTLALVANRSEGTVSIFTISGKTVTPVGLLKLGDDKIGASHVAISPDGKTALVSRDGDDRISVLSIDGTKVEYTKRDLNAGPPALWPRHQRDGTYAAVANIGRGGGDSDTVSLIDMTAEPRRVVDTITVGQTPEGLKISPDGKWIAAVVMNGSNKAEDSPFFADAGKLVLLRPDGGRLVKVAEAPIGHWSQGVAFSADGKTILVGNMVEKNLQVFDWNGSTLKEAGHHQAQRRLRGRAHRRQVAAAAMDIGCHLPTQGPVATREALLTFAREAERHRMASLWVSDHVIFPRTATGSYPGGRFPHPPDKAYLEPVAVLAAAAVCTTHARLGASVFILGHRHPVVMAKMLTTIDALSSGRLICGVGVGWWKEEMEILGAPFHARGRQADEILRSSRSCGRPTTRRSRASSSASATSASPPSPCRSRIRRSGWGATAPAPSAGS